jgi:uncharacterized membrane protein YhaH (DUF805 family)
LIALPDQEFGDAGISWGDEMDWKYLFLSMDGRIGRRTFWMGVVVLVVAVVVASVLDAILHTPSAGSSGAISIIVSILLIYPWVALSAKRWHDRNKSAWWILIGLIPIIGAIWAFVEVGCLKGTTGQNRFGADPV